MTPFSDFDSMDWVDNYDSVVESDSGAILPVLRHSAGSI